MGEDTPRMVKNFYPMIGFLNVQCPWPPIAERIYKFVPGFPILSNTRLFNEAAGKKGTFNNGQKCV